MLNVQPERQRNYDDFIYIPNIIFKSMGYDFLNTPKPLWQDLLLRAYSIICIASHLIIVYYFTLRLIEWDSLKGNPTIIVRYGTLISFVLNSDVKIIIFMCYRRRLRALNVNFVFCIQVKHRNAKIVLAVLGPILQSVFIYLYQHYTQESGPKFLYLSAYPMQRFNHMTPANYAFSQLVDYTFSHLIMNVNLGTDIWMMCFSGQLCMHFAYLGSQLESYSPSRQREPEDLKFLNSLVRKHQHLFNLQRELNEIFGMLLAYNLFTTSTTLCCVAFYTILQGVNREGFSFLLFFFSAAAQFYMVSYYGKQMIDLSENIALAAYTQNWYNGSPKYRKHLLFIMQRAQRSAEISARGVIIISLDTFKRMINISYRFFAIIRKLLLK